MNEEKRKLKIEKLKLKKALVENEGQLIEMAIKKLSDATSEDDTE